MAKEIKDVLLITGDDKSVSLKDSATFLFDQQLSSRPELQKIYNELKNVQVKNFSINENNIELHFNPSRIRSTAALTDDISISSRKCFLCFDNLPEEQKGIEYGDHLLLVNPYPIFPAHFTIPHKEHKPQRIYDCMNDLLTLSSTLSPYLTLFYNGPECGASAPDHLHFQAGTKGFLPLENELPLMEKISRKIYTKGKGVISSIDDNLRKIILIRGSTISEIESLFRGFYNIYKKYAAGVKEPMLNILSIYDSNEWIIFIFLREKHRPAVYYLQRGGFMLSPAAADLSGVCIVPVKEHFEGADAALLQEIFREVSFPPEKFSLFINELKDSF